MGAVLLASLLGGLRGARAAAQDSLRRAAPAAGGVHDSVRDALRERLEHRGAAPEIVTDGERLHNTRRLVTFYAGRAFEPAWVDGTGVRPALRELVAALRGAAEDGLNPADYHVAALERALARLASDPPTPARLADLDLLASDGFLGLAGHLLAGHVDPATTRSSWYVERPRADLVALLGRAAETGEVRRAFAEVSPRDPAYHTLKLALAAHEAIARRGGWPRVPTGATLRAGMVDPRVVTLRARLAVSGDLASEGGIAAADTSPAFDDALQRAVARFQWRHGLEVDSAVGPATVRALNVPAVARATQIRVNLERWRWLPPVLGERYVMVNVPEFRVRVVEAGRPVLDMAAIVGRPLRESPIFTDTMTYLVFSPYWNIPPGITAKDILPKVRANPKYLELHGIRVFRGSGTTPVDPRSVDWKAVTAANNPYRFRQDPGPENAMGLVKFMLPNRFDVYLHDTPDKHLFARAVRNFSSGCIRIAQPVELAEYVLGPNGGWDRAAIEAAMHAGTERVVRLARPVPVHVLYFTAWADVDGTTHFRDDLYERDAPLARALATAAPR